MFIINVEQLATFTEWCKEHADELGQIEVNASIWQDEDGRIPFIDMNTKHMDPSGSYAHLDVVRA